MVINQEELPPLDIAKIRQQKRALTTIQKESDTSNGGKVILGWILVITVIAALSRSRTGYVILYYVLWLGVILILLAGYRNVIELVGLVQAPNGPSGE